MPTVLPYPFVGASMTSIRRLSQGHPVYTVDYMVTPRAVATYVVKAEVRKSVITDMNGRTTQVGRREQQRAVQTSIQLMRDAARGGRGRVLDDKEVQSLFDRARLLLAAAEIAGFKATADANAIWVLYGMKAGLVELSDVVQGASVLRATQLLAALRDPENLDRLGRILATDMFLGNRDRFSNDVGTQGIRNATNVFFVEKATGEFKIKGLDVFDHTQNNALMSTTVTAGCANDPRPINVSYWGGPLLRDPLQLRRVASNALTSMYDELAAVLRNANVGAGIVRNAAFEGYHIDAVVAGMNAALVVIKASCKQRLAQMRRAKVDTAGLKSRMQLMHWST